MPEPQAKRSGMDFAEWKAAWGVRLNDQQEAAVQAAEGPVLLLAVPGLPAAVVQGLIWLCMAAMLLSALLYIPVFSRLWRMEPLP